MTVKLKAPENKKEHGWAFENRVWAFIVPNVNQSLSPGLRAQAWALSISERCNKCNSLQQRPSNKNEKNEALFFRSA